MTGRVLVIERVQILRSVDFFSGVPGRILAAVADEADEVELAAGAVLMRRGDLGDALFVVVDGTLAVDVGTSRVNEIGAGSVVGELAALVAEARSATVTALEPCLLLQLRREVLEDLLLDHPEIAMGIIATLVRRFRSQVDRAEARGDTDAG